MINVCVEVCVCVFVALGLNSLCVCICCLNSFRMVILSCGALVLPILATKGCINVGLKTSANQQVEQTKHFWLRKCGGILKTTCKMHVFWVEDPFDLNEGNAFFVHLPSYILFQPSVFHLPPAQKLLFRGTTGLVGASVVFTIPISHFKASIHPFHDLCNNYCPLFSALAKTLVILWSYSTSEAWWRSWLYSCCGRKMGGSGAPMVLHWCI